MELPKFNFNDNEEMFFIVPAKMTHAGQTKNIRLMLTSQRIVLLTRETASHVFTILLMAAIAVVIAIFLLAVLHIHGLYLPLILTVVFCIAATVQLHYRACNPRLHRIIAEYQFPEAVIADELIFLPENREIHLDLIRLTLMKEKIKSIN